MNWVHKGGSWIGSTRVVYEFGSTRIVHGLGPQAQVVRRLAPQEWIGLIRVVHGLGP